MKLQNSMLVSYEILKLLNFLLELPILLNKMLVSVRQILDFVGKLCNKQIRFVVHGFYIKD